MIDELADLDARIAARGVVVWVGAEPTFTLASSTEPWWLWQADAPEKRAYAEKLAAALAAGGAGSREPEASADGGPASRRQPASPDANKPFTEIPGRHYPEEAAPRFCLAVGGATVTPDPGVVEVNTAPCPDSVAFLEHARAVYAAAAAAGLAPRRLRFNGDVVDSGGGGQLTIGGPPGASPFALHPSLLPRLVAFAQNHPALSYWFLGEMAGSASQSPRADEGVRERWEELRVACALLEPGAPIETQWATLAPLLVDAAGNSHRAELNVEKLANPHLGERGQMGVVELRAFRMAPTPEHLAAAAALVRAIAARCALAPVEGFVDWSSKLHDRWGLPTFLREDLTEIFRELDAHGLGLGAELERLCAEYRAPVLWSEGDVTISRALEFWPLIGDVASQERATSRLVDASSERLELAVSADLEPALVIGDARVRMRTPRPGLWLIGLRRRVFVPSPGLHPTLSPQDPLVFSLGDTTIAWHGWRPGGGAYDGIPADEAEAARRRAERIVVTTAAPATPTRELAPDGWTLDLRSGVRGSG